MPYCSASDVRAIIDTSLTDTQIAAIIDESDAWIDKQLGAQSASDKLIRKLSKLITAREVKTQQPTSTQIGDYSETHNPILFWDQQIQDILKMYRASKLKSTPYQHIDEDERYLEET